MADPLIRELEALRVGPDEVLILKIGGDWIGDEDDDHGALAGLLEQLKSVGLARTLVFTGDVEFAIAQRDACDHEWIGAYDIPVAEECRKCQAIRAT